MSETSAPANGFRGELNNDWKTKFEGMSLPDLGREFMSQKDRLAELKQETKLLQAEHDYLRLGVIPDKLEELEMSSVNIKGLGRLGLTLDAYVTVLAENREEFYEWLEANDHGAMIKPYANPSTVKAWAKDMAKREAEGEEGCELPEDLISVEPFYRAAVTKK
ncbi:hypothetical protein VPHK225_0031 [Vibrio phage K225]|nr:hypothetical protein PODOV044v1_p0031 [Vibrio phage 23E28.1]QZI92060.1 hypothetical protein PODOV045v1_p0018 [Vibrio phage 69E27.1]